MKTDRCCCCELVTGTLILLICEILAVMITFIKTADNKHMDFVDIATVIYGFVRLGAAILGLWGVSQKRANYLMPFLITNIITTFSSVIVGTLWPEKVIEEASEEIPYPLILIIMALGTALSVYFIIVIRSYIAQLKEEEEAKMNANQNTTSVA